MAFKDEFREEREAITKHGTFGQKWRYFWDYNILRVIGISLAVFAIGFFGYDILSQPNILLNGIFVNTLQYEGKTPEKDLADGFLKSQGIKDNKTQVAFTTNFALTGENAADFQTQETITVQSGAGSLDFVVCPVNHLMDFAYGGVFADLREVLSAEELETYKSRLLYIDLTVYEYLESTSGDATDAKNIVFPDCTKPEEMENPVPIFINVDDCSKITNLYSYDPKDLCFGISITTPHAEQISKFLDYIIE